MTSGYCPSHLASRRLDRQPARLVSGPRLEAKYRAAEARESILVRRRRRRRIIQRPLDRRILTGARCAPITMDNEGVVKHHHGRRIVGSHRCFRIFQEGGRGDGRRQFGVAEIETWSRGKAQHDE